MESLPSCVQSTEGAVGECSHLAPFLMLSGYNNYLMKFVLKRQMRWLIFMLVPFICLLLVHVLVPLLFLTTSTPLLQETYNIQKKDLQFRTIYSFQQINQQIITARLIQYYKIFENLHYLIEQQKLDLLLIDPSFITLNNAHNITQEVAKGVRNANFSQPVSMWHAPNCSSFEGLNDLQKYTYFTYASVEPYIRSLVTLDDSSSLIGIRTHLSTENVTIAYQYPSEYEEQFIQINGTAFSAFDQSLIDQYLTKNQQITSGLQFSDDGEVTLSLCTVLLGDGEPYGVSCLRFDLGKLAQELFEIVNFAHSDYFKTSYSIVIPLVTPTQTTYVRAIKINQTGGYPITSDAISSSIIGQVLPVSSSADDTITINGSSTTILGPLIIEDDLIEQSSLLYLGSRNTYVSTSLANSTQFDNQINLTIGLITSIIAVVSILTIVIMKTIMNNLDEELIGLSNYCTFIVEDDLKIEIPAYEGTKDVQEVYERVRVINKLNKYSHPNYFTGHFIDKILSYCEAQKFLKKIQYDAGALLQNIGNSYFYMEEVEKTIEYYKESVRCILTKIRQEYGTIDQIFEWKQQARLPKAYREYEIVLIRRLFNLIESYNCLLECHMASDIRENENEIIKDILDYIDLFKKAVYPDFHMYAEFILVLFYEIKLRLYKDCVDVAQKILTKAETLCQIYINSYAEVGKKMREKGSKNKLLHMKNKITSHSRMHPQKIKTFLSYFKALVLLKSHHNHTNRYEALKILFEGTKVGIFSNRITWMIFKKIHTILQFYDVSEYKLFSLSIYNQICLLKNIRQKQFHSESCPYRYPSELPKQEQEYIYLVDSLANSCSESVQSYFQTRSIHIYDKFIKDMDRVSIMKFNTSQGIKIECNLTMKQSKEQILRKQIHQSFLQPGSYRFLKNELFQAFEKVIYRVMKLKSEKVILIFFQSLVKYRSHLHYIRKKQRSRVKRMNSINIDETNRQGLPVPEFSEFGEWVQTVVRESGIEKTKICLFCDEEDKMEDFREFFGLKDINRRLWSEEKGINAYHNCVYVIEKDHKVDIERLLSKRLYAVPDNHIFIL